MIVCCRLRSLSNSKRSARLPTSTFPMWSSPAILHMYVCTQDMLVSALIKTGVGLVGGYRSYLAGFSESMATASPTGTFNTFTREWSVLRREQQLPAIVFCPTKDINLQSGDISTVVCVCLYSITVYLKVTSHFHTFSIDVVDCGAFLRLHDRVSHEYDIFEVPCSQNSRHSHWVPVHTIA